jgi:hypothetical protein
VVDQVNLEEKNGKENLFDFKILILIKKVVNPVSIYYMSA